MIKKLLLFVGTLLLCAPVMTVAAEPNAQKAREGCVIEIVTKMVHDPDIPGSGHMEEVEVVKCYSASSSGSDASSEPAPYDPCATSNPALAGKGCLYYLNGQVVMANGDGTITTAAGNVFDSQGNNLSR